MSLTRKLLRSMGIEDEKVDQIIEAHTEVTDALKKELAEAEGWKTKHDEVAAELDKARGGEDWKARYESERDGFDEYKRKVEAEKAEGLAKALLTEQLEELGITGSRAKTIVKTMDASSVEVEDGKLKDPEKVKADLIENWGDLIPKTKIEGAKVDTPPANGGGAKTRNEIMEIKDASERQAAWAELIASESE